MVISYASNACLRRRARSHKKNRELNPPCPPLWYSADRSRTQISDCFKDAKEYYDFLEHKRTIKFYPHPSRCDPGAYEPFELALNSKINYDALAERVGSQLEVSKTHLRFWTVNTATNNPKTPVRRGINVQNTLRQILNPLGTSSLNSSQRGDALYFEVLEMSLAELDTKKSIKLTWLSEGMSKEVSFIA